MWIRVGGLIEFVAREGIKENKTSGLIVMERMLFGYWLPLSCEWQALLNHRREIFSN